jgi:hypothetical protein
MAFTGSYIPTSFRQQLLEGVHDFRSGQHVFKLALYGSSATLNASTQTYTPDGEVPTSGGYVAGGVILTPIGPSVGQVTFSDVTVHGTEIEARGALIYNATPAHTYTNPAVAVLDFGSIKISSSSGLLLRFGDIGGPSVLLRVDT